MHRLLYRVLVGEIPDGMELDHRCRNRDCANPDHLDVVTTYENLHRGEGFTARRAAQTECIHGHPFTPSNTRRRKNGTRVCRRCSIIRRRGYDKAARLAA